MAVISLEFKGKCAFYRRVVLKGEMMNQLGNFEFCGGRKMNEPKNNLRSKTKTNKFSMHKALS